MYMERSAERPVGRMLWLLALALLVALVAAVSAFAVGGSTTAADPAASAPLQTQTVQDSQATPAPERGDREDCPEKDGAGRGDGAGQGGSQPEDQSTAPDTSAETPQL
jgi:hypothetical protein